MHLTHFQNKDQWRQKEKFHAKLKAHTKDTTTDPAKAIGTCGLGIGMDRGYVAFNFNNTNKRKKRPNTCPLSSCRHITIRSKK